MPFDDRINIKANIYNLEYPLLRNYLYAVNSNLKNEINQKSLEEIAFDLRIADGSKEYYKPINVGLLFFNDNPEQFFPYARIEIVNIPDPTGQSMEEMIFTGSIE